MQVLNSLLTLKSKDKYMLSYTNFIQWKNSKNANSFSENVFMAYSNEVEKFIKEAPDSQYLATKFFPLLTSLRGPLLMYPESGIPTFINAISGLHDDYIKESLCFGETLLISCGHYDGFIGEDENESEEEWSCHSTTESEKSVVKPKVEKEAELETVDEEPSVHGIEEEGDFHFFFFPDCNKPPPPANSKASLFIGPDGLPVVNVVQRAVQLCTCPETNTDRCECFAKTPCSCGAKVTVECTCKELETVCVCKDVPDVICTCTGSDVCMCFSDKIPRPDCACEDVDKPCICMKFPNVVCKCKEKPKFKPREGIKPPSIGESVSSEMAGEVEGEMEGEMEESEKVPEEQQPCVCQEPEPPPPCSCQEEEVEDKKCECWGPKDPCVCDPPPVCRCEKCNCFPEPIVCTCGDPENCRCYKMCKCIMPCLCRMEEIPLECECPIKDPPECTCRIKEDEGLKIKKVRTGKDGFRWCHDVDPRHTYFDYAYDRHDKIDIKEQKREKLKIMGLHDEKEEVVEGVPVVQAEKPPVYEKKVRKPSLDCCSTVGGMSISVECLGEDKDKFLIQVVSHSSKEGAKAGTKLVSIVDCNLHTMEENRTEHITKKDLTKERRSYMAVCETGYFNKVTKICGERHVIKRFYHDFKDSRHFLLEGANVVMLRYLGLSRYRGNIRTETVLIDGVVCENIYVCLGMSPALVNGKQLFVCKVERHIIEPNGVLHQTLSVISLRGYLVSHEWADNNYFIHINPLLNIISEKDIIEPHVPLRSSWREDLQLLSDYLDFKSTRTSEGGRYMSENGTLTSIVRDYLQALLMLRPQDGLHFTRHYFATALSALDLPHDEYFDSCNKHVRYHFFED